MLSNERTEFIATAASGKWVSVDREGEATVKLAVPASHLPQVLRLLAWAEVPLRVTVEPDTGSRQPRAASAA